MSTESVFKEIADRLESEVSGVTHGSMMKAPGLKYNNKVFTFWHEEAMCFKLGKTFDPEAHGISHWTYLSPFKNKPPMKAWVYLSADYRDRWPEFAEMALEMMQK